MLVFLKKKTRKAVAEVKKMENRDTVEATVWGGFYIAYYDGECTPEEVSIKAGSATGEYLKRLL